MTHHEHNGHVGCCPTTEDEESFKTLPRDEGRTFGGCSGHHHHINNDVRSHLLEIEEIKNVHYLHPWLNSSSGISFSCHLVVPDQMVSQTERPSQCIRHSIFHKFGIDHPILQFETESCGNGSLLCEKFTGSKKETTA